MSGSLSTGNGAGSGFLGTGAGIDPSGWGASGGSGGSSSAGSSSTSLANSSNSMPIIGPIVSGLGSIFSGQVQGQEDDNRSIIYTQQAQLDRYNAGTQVTKNSEQATQTLSAASAQAGGSGVTTAGSPTQAQRQTINRANAADVQARWIGAIHSSSDLYQAQLARWAGSQSRLSGEISGISDFAQAGMQAASIFG